MLAKLGLRAVVRVHNTEVTTCADHMVWNRLMPRPTRRWLNDCGKGEHAGAGMDNYSRLAVGPKPTLVAVPKRPMPLDALGGFGPIVSSAGGPAVGGWFAGEVGNTPFPSGRWTVPKSVRVSVVVLGALVTALAPLFSVLSLADSYGWDRESARSIAFVVTILLLGGWYLVIRKLGRSQSRRDVGEGLDRKLAQHRDEGDKKDKR